MSALSSLTYEFDPLGKPRLRTLCKKANPIASRVGVVLLVSFPFYTNSSFVMMTYSNKRMEIEILSCKEEDMDLTFSMCSATSSSNRL